jgi:hypothetical protein
MKCSSTKSYDPYCELPEVSKSGVVSPQAAKKRSFPATVPCSRHALVTIRGQVEPTGMDGDRQQTQQTAW